MSSAEGQHWILAIRVAAVSIDALTDNVQIVLGELASAECMKLVCRRMFTSTGGWGRRHSSSSLIS